MARVSFDSYPSNSTQNATENPVQFFSLKNDGDSAIVRFIEDSTSEFEILTTHAITINGKYRAVNCIRDAHDPLNKCPLCESGSEVRKRIFIKLIRYDIVNNEVVATPCIWERSMAYAFKLKEYIDNYGPLSDVICKITRRGQAGDIHTDYEISPNLNKNVYRDDLYVLDKTPFTNYSALGTVILDKPAADISTYLKTGNFPMSGDSSQDQQPAQYVRQDQNVNNGFNTVTDNFTTGGPNVMPWEQPQMASAVPSGNMNRPVRYY